MRKHNPTEPLLTGTPRSSLLDTLQHSITPQGISGQLGIVLPQDPPNFSSRGSVEPVFVYKSVVYPKTGPVGVRSLRDRLPGSFLTETIWNLKAYIQDCVFICTDDYGKFRAKYANGIVRNMLYSMDATKVDIAFIKKKITTVNKSLPMIFGPFHQNLVLALVFMLDSEDPFCIIKVRKELSHVVLTLMTDSL